MKALSPALCPSKRKRLTSLSAAVISCLAPGASPVAAREAAAFQPPPLEVRDGFEVTIAAAPPLLNYPMMACLDDRGRLYVAESDGRNLTTRQEIENERPRFVRRLTDTDGDGVFDQSTIFADKMTMPEGGLWHDGALYIISAPYLWRLEDTDDDGVADRRDKILGQMEFDGRANQHGPYLGPNGRLYFSGGHFGYQFTGTDGSRTGQSRAGGIFSCRPDGSDVRIDGQGPINPVDVVFTRSGEMLSTAAIYDSFGGRRHDALIHWFPRGLTQRIYGEPLLPQTGLRVPATIRWGQVAPAGLMRYRGTQFGPAYRDSLFACHFNSNSVRHIRLIPDGATFQTEDADFLTSSSRDFHPADILEDADGSLLLLDTGGWLSWGCPHSKAAKPEVRGAVYRIRRRGGASHPDPRGTAINWASSSPLALVKLLADSRPAVRDRAEALLRTKGQAALEPLAHASTPEASKDPDLRRRAVFALSQLPTPGLSRALGKGLRDPDPGVRQAVARSLGELRSGETTELLVATLSDPNPAVRRAVATALGRIGNSQAVEPLFRALQPDSQPAFQHAVRLALIEIGDPAACRPQLESPQPFLRATALRVMEQIDPACLDLKALVPSLRSPVPILRDEARRIVATRPEWKEQVFDLFLSLLTEDDLPLTSSTLAEEIIMSYPADENFHLLLGRQLREPSVPTAGKLLIVHALGYLESLPEPSATGIAFLLAEHSGELRAAAAELVLTSRSYQRFRQGIDAIAANSEEHSLTRVTALEAIAAHGGKLNDAQFAVAATALSAPDPSPKLGQRAARALSHLTLTPPRDRQCNTLLDLIRSSTPMTLGFLLKPFERLDPGTWPTREFDSLGAALAEALQSAPGLKSLRAEQLAALSRPFSATYPQAHRAFSLLAGDQAGNAAERAQRLDDLLAVTGKGNASRGRALFHANRSTCSQCHAIGNRGGTLGPNLSRIGSIRSVKDLLEAIVFPSATVVNGFETYLLTEKQGHTHAGVIHRETTNALYLRQADQGIVRISRNEIRSLLRSPVSLMPAGLDGVLSDQDLADLVAYLQVCR